MRCKRRTRHCVCARCGHKFATDAGLDRHRVGPHDARRCMTPTEMREAGMVKDRVRWHLRAKPKRKRVFHRSFQIEFTPGLVTRT